MKIPVLITALCLSSFFMNAQATSTVQIDETMSPADALPEYPGGFGEMMKFMHTNIKYPKTAVDGKKSGKGMIKVTVMEDGSLSEISVIKNIPGCPECDEEAIRVIKTMPKWIPGKLAGKTVPLLYNIPISFRLPQ